MLSRNTISMMEFLLGSPLNKYNVNQLARELKISVGSVHKIAKELEKRGILRSEEFGNNILYTLNLENKEARKICELVLIEAKNKCLARNPVARVYVEELEKTSIGAVVLFGSILTKREKARDVDVLFVVKNKKQVRTVNDLCLRISKIKTKPIVPLIMTEKDLENKLKEKNEVVLEIMKKGIALSGEDIIIEVLSHVQGR